MISYYCREVRMCMVLDKKLVAVVMSILFLWFVNDVKIYLSCCDDMFGIR